MISGTGDRAGRSSRSAAGSRPTRTSTLPALYPVRVRRPGRQRHRDRPRSLAVFGRAGWVDRFTPIDEAAVYGDLGRNWMQTGGYTEMTSAVNPFPPLSPTASTRSMSPASAAQ